MNESLEERKNLAQDKTKEKTGSKVSMATAWANEGEKWLKIGVAEQAGSPGSGHPGPCSHGKKFDF